MIPVRNSLAFESRRSKRIVMKKRAGLIVNTKGRVERVPCLAAEPQMTFTHGMMAARLAMGALASLAAGAVTKAVTRSNTRVSWVLAVFLLAAFIPVHVRLWTKFPVWHHLVFLGTLVPLILLATTFPRNRSRIEPGVQGGSAR